MGPNPNINLQKSFWDSLHEAHYHYGEVQGIIDRINLERGGNTEWSNVFDKLGKIIGEEIDVKDKTVLEIGHGGGWYLAQHLDNGARFVIGLEINETRNLYTEQAFRALNYSNYKFYKVDERCLDIVEETNIDIIHSMTVFQHIDPKLTEYYLRSAHRILAPTGNLYVQFRVVNASPIKHLSGLDIRYTESEIHDLCKLTNFEILAKGYSHHYGLEDDFWGIYKLGSLK